MEYPEKIKEYRRTIYEQRRQNPEWVESQQLYARVKAKQYNEEGRVQADHATRVEPYGLAKLREHANTYYKNIVRQILRLEPN